MRPTRSRARSARRCVAPVITYVPEGSWENPAGHMGKPGTITLPEDRFVELLVNAGRSLKAGGFKTILFLGESGGNRTGMRTAAEKLNELWKGSGARAFWIDDYYTKSHADQNKYITEKLGIPADKIGGHANILDTSEMLFVNPKHVRKDEARARRRLREQRRQRRSVEVDAGARQGASPDQDRQRARADQRADGRHDAAGDRRRPAAAAADAAGGGGRGQAQRHGGRRDRRPTDGRRRRRPARRRRAPDTVFIDELTWEETRDAIKAGKTTVIVPTGGTEKNGYHMVLGKHNYVVTHAANLMARRLKNALVAPTIQYVPEGDPDTSVPGEISLPSPAYDLLLDAAARSLKAHGFTDILFIGDSGGNQAGMTSVADKLNEEWKGTGAKVFALTDYYNASRVHYRAWLQAAFGYDDETVGSHAGISDTSQMLFVRPAGIRKDQIKPWGGPQDSGVSGDPTKATAEIGKMGDRVQGERGPQPVQAAEEPASARRPRRRRLARNNYGTAR